MSVSITIGMEFIGAGAERRLYGGMSVSMTIAKFFEAGFCFCPECIVLHQRCHLNSPCNFWHLDSEHIYLKLLIIFIWVDFHQIALATLTTFTSHMSVSLKQDTKMQ